MNVKLATLLAAFLCAVMPVTIAHAQFYTLSDHLVAYDGQQSRVALMKKVQPDLPVFTIYDRIYPDGISYTVRRVIRGSTPSGISMWTFQTDSGGVFCKIGSNMWRKLPRADQPERVEEIEWFGRSAWMKVGTDNKTLYPVQGERYTAKLGRHFWLRLDEGYLRVRDAPQWTSAFAKAEEESSFQLTTVNIWREFDPWKPWDNDPDPSLGEQDDRADRRGTGRNNGDGRREIDTERDAQAARDEYWRRIREGRRSRDAERARIRELVEGSHDSSRRSSNRSNTESQGERARRVRREREAIARRGFSAVVKAHKAVLRLDRGVSKYKPMLGPGGKGQTLCNLYARDILKTELSESYPGLYRKIAHVFEDGRGNPLLAGDMLNNLRSESYKEDGVTHVVHIRGNRDLLNAKPDTATPEHLKAWASVFEAAQAARNQGYPVIAVYKEPGPVQAGRAHVMYVLPRGPDTLHSNASWQRKGPGWWMKYPERHMIPNIAVTDAGRIHRIKDHRPYAPRGVKESTTIEFSLSRQQLQNVIFRGVGTLEFFAVSPNGERREYDFLDAG